MADKSTRSAGNTPPLTAVTASGNCHTTCIANRPSVTFKGPPVSNVRRWYAWSRWATWGGLPDRALMHRVIPVSTKNGIIKINQETPTSGSVAAAIKPSSAKKNPSGIAPASPINNLAGGQLNQSIGAQHTKSSAHSQLKSALLVLPNIAMRPRPVATHSA